jgi:two-component system, sensor histidine kinase
MDLADEKSVVADGYLGGPPGRHLPVLVVEDNPDGRETLSVLLQCLGYAVEVAADGWEGLAKGLSGRPAIALIDIGLPGLNGYQVASALRAAFGRKIFLVAQTGYGQPEDRRRALESGFDVHLVKPLDLNELCHWLQVGELGLSPARPEVSRGPAGRQTAGD